MKNILKSLLVMGVITGYTAVVHSNSYYFPSEETVNKKSWNEAIDQAEKQRKVFENVQPLPNNLPNVEVGQFTNIDVEQIAKRYKKKGEAQKAKVDGLIAFASFSMPRESLKKLIVDTKKVGGTVMFIGFKGGTYMSMANEIAKLKLEGANIQINPNAFEQYKIKSVPAIVLVKPNGEEKLDTEGCVLPDNYSKVSGDVSIDHALTLMSEKEKPDLKIIAQKYLKDLRGQN